MAVRKAKTASEAAPTTRKRPDSAGVPGSAKRGRKDSSSGKTGKAYSWPVLFWLAFAILILGLYLFNREAISSGIQTVRNEIAARKALQEDKPVSVPAPGTLVSPPPAAPSPVAPAPKAQPAPVQPASSPRQAPVSPSQAPSRPPPKNVQEGNLGPGKTVGPQPRQEVQPQAGRSPEAVRSTAELRERSLYFTQVDRGGSILRIKVDRKLPVSDSPMMDVIQALIAGPSGDEKSRGLISLIPADTQVLSATVRGTTAYISFSEDFQYNTYGVEGYAAQLRQIVYTVTEFSNVRDVQILIEGNRVDYLGEGIWIGSPISREML